MANSFSVGDKVVISPESPYYGADKYNPMDTVGIITKVDLVGEFLYTVYWGNEIYNIYRYEDLLFTGTSPNWYGSKIVFKFV